MNPNPFLGVILHAIGGLAAGSFYIPFRKVRRWSWETYWLTQGFAAWILTPWILAWLTTPDLWTVFSHSPLKNMLLTYMFGALWGIGGLTFGLSMRYLGLSLGMSLALGFCATFGTIIPPLFAGNAASLFTTLSGLMVLAGVMACLGGISICCYAGILKERELTDEQKKQAIKEFALTKGFAVAIFSGIMSACMAFAIEAGKPIAQAALDAGTQDLFKNNPVFIIAMGGGFTTNFIWCLYLNIKNNSLQNYVYTKSKSVLMLNYFLAGLGGTIWYLQFFFYGMGTTRMGKYDFSSWSIHMAFIIIFSNMWGLIFKEWKNSRRRTYYLVFTGLLILVLSTLIIGYANYLEAQAIKDAPVVTELRCEYQEAPLGVDTERLRFSWIITDEDRGVLQSAYQILVATSLETLNVNNGDMWDSGKVVSSQSTHVLYAGKALISGARYYWKVRTWDQTGQESPYSDPTWFEMGLLKPEDWTGHWIEPANIPPIIEEWKTRFNNKPPDPVPSCAFDGFDDSNWSVLQAHSHYDKYGSDHHHKTGDPLESQVGYAWYRTRIQAQKDAKGRLSPQLLYFRNALQNIWIFVNDKLVIQTADNTNFAFHVAPYLHEGHNLVALCIQRTNPHEHHPGGLRTKVKMGIEDNLLRKSFAVGKQIKRARAYISGLGYYELRINGEKVGDHQLDPGWTDYKKSTIYSAYDITDNLKKGGNAIGVMLGHGHHSGFGLSYGNFLKMILQVNIEKL